MAIKKHMQLPGRIKKTAIYAYTYESFFPRKGLEDIVMRYWSTVAHRDLELQDMPDGHMKIIFYFHAAGAKNAIKTSGLSDVPSIIKMKKHSQIIGINLRWGGFFSLFRRPANFFANRPVSLESIIGSQAASGFEKVFSVKNLPARIRIIDSNLAKLAENHMPLDPKIKIALDEIHDYKGCVQIIDLARQLEMSTKQLNRKFEEWIGINPKIFCSIVRFYNAWQELRATDKSLAAIALEAGYHDQAHFLHEFKKFHWLTPAQLKDILRVFKYEREY